MPAKAKNALASLSAAHKTLDEAFGVEIKRALMVAAECGAWVAITFGRLSQLEAFLLAPSTQEAIEKALVYPNKNELDGTGRSLKVKIGFVPSLHGLFTGTDLPLPDVRKPLATLAPAFEAFADALGCFQALYGLSNQLRSFYQDHPEAEGLLKQLTNAKHLMTAYMQRAAIGLGIKGRLSTTQLAAMAIVIDIEDSGAPTAVYKARWLKVRDASRNIEGLLLQLPAVEVGTWGMKLKVELPENTERPFMKVLAGHG
jgi:hypothetical protein